MTGPMDGIHAMCGQTVKSSGLGQEIIIHIISLADIINRITFCEKCRSRMKPTTCFRHMVL